MEIKKCGKDNCSSKENEGREDINQIEEKGEINEYSEREVGDQVANDDANDKYEERIRGDHDGSMEEYGENMRNENSDINGEDNELLRNLDNETNDKIEYRIVPFSTTHSLLENTYCIDVICIEQYNFIQLPDNLDDTHEQNVVQFGDNSHGNRSRICIRILANGTNEILIVDLPNDIYNTFSNIFSSISNLNNFGSTLNDFLWKVHLSYSTETNNRIIPYRTCDNQSTVFVDFGNFGSILDTFSQIGNLRFSETNEGRIMLYGIHNNRTNYRFILSLSNFGSILSTFTRNNYLNSSEIHENVMPYGIRNLSIDFPVYSFRYLNHFGVLLNTFLRHVSPLNSFEGNEIVRAPYDSSDILSANFLNLCIRYVLRNVGYTLYTFPTNAISHNSSVQMYSIRNIGRSSRCFAILRDVRLDNFYFSPGSILSLRERVFARNGYRDVFTSRFLHIMGTRNINSISHFDVDLSNIDRRSFIHIFLDYIVDQL